MDYLIIAAALPVLTSMIITTFASELADGFSKLYATGRLVDIALLAAGIVYLPLATALVIDWQGAILGYCAMKAYEYLPVCSEEKAKLASVFQEINRDIKKFID